MVFEDAYVRIIWPVLFSSRVKFKIYPESWLTFLHKIPRTSWLWAVTPVMLYKCHASWDWRLPYNRRAFGLQALSENRFFRQRLRQNEQWSFLWTRSARINHCWEICYICKLLKVFLQNIFFAIRSFFEQDFNYFTIYCQTFTVSGFYHMSFMAIHSASFDVKGHLLKCFYVKLWMVN